MSAMIRISTAGGATYAPTWEAVAGLSAKLADLSRQIGPVIKDGTNQHFRYQFVSYEQVAAVIRSKMAEVGLSFSIGASSREQMPKGALLTIEATFTDNETGAMRVVYWYGEGQDTQDKATAKALTSAVKYGLMRMFLLSTQDDVDADADAPPPQKKNQDAPPPRPYAPDVLRKAFSVRLAGQPDTPPSAGKRGATVGALNNLFLMPGASEEAATDMRHKLTKFLVGKEHSAMWTEAQCDVFLAWAKAEGNDGPVPHPMAVQEAAKIVVFVKAQQEQKTLAGEPAGPDEGDILSTY